MFMAHPRTVLPDKQHLNNEGHKNGFDHGLCRSGNYLQCTLDHPSAAYEALMHSTEHMGLQPSPFTPLYFLLQHVPST